MQNKKIVLLLIAALIVFTAAKKPENQKVKKVKDNGKSKEDKANGQQNNGQGNGRGVDNVVVTIPMTSEDLVLNLTTANDINASLPVIVMENGQLKKWKSDEEMTVYRDKSKMASFLMVKGKKNAKGVSKMSYSATFMMRDGMYEAEAESIEGDTQPADDVIGSTMFVNMKTKKTKVKKMDKDDKLEFAEDTRGKSGKSRSRRQAEDDQPTGERAERIDNDFYSGGQLVNGVELLLIIDYSAYKKRYDVSQYRYHEDRHADAIRSLKYFYFHVINGVDMRYQSIQETDFRIYVRLSALMIATTSYESPWTETSGIADYYNNYRHTEVYQAIEYLEDWINTEENLPHFDHAMLFSANELWNGYRSDGSRRTINGLSSVGHICRYMRASIGKEVSMAGVIQTAAHELGHNLGANHDSPTYGSCNSKDQYVMASGPAELTESNHLNVFKFSVCSIQDFRSHLFNIAQSTGSCLLNTASHQDPSDVEYYLRKFPGQEFDLDYQCQQILGLDSFYCGGGRYDMHICRQMMCFHPRQRRCYTDAEQRAADGTTCGNGQWCLNNDCVTDWRAPAAADSCLYGDYADLVGSSGLRCVDLVNQDPSICYRERESEDCCYSCGQKKDLEHPDCPYGDHESSYCSNIYPRECYDENTRSRCCKTCEGHMTSTKVGCEYGDHASWCSNIDSFDCYISGETCCSKCNDLCNGPEECPCGDHLSYCIQFEPRECYDSKKARNCCDYCAKMKTGPEGCEFGDRERYCVKSECSDPNRWESCCKTCEDEIAAGSGAIGLTCPLAGDLVYWCGKISNRDCYHSYYQDNCCATCKQHETGIQSCEFGNKASWCPNYAKTKQDCLRSDISDLCCASCHRINTGVESVVDMPCEDMASWCSDIFAGQCYDANTEATCCETCKRLKTSSTDCAYGNHYTWCKAQYCNTDGEKCCVSCP